MAFYEFVTHVRAARSLLPPDVVASGLAAAPGHVEKALASADVWLRPEFADPFDPADCPLPDDSLRERFLASMAALRALAAEVGADGTPTRAQRRDGLNHLLAILTVVLHPAFVDPLAERLANTLWKLEVEYPEFVLGFACEFGTDWSGDPAVRVTVTVPSEGVIGDPRFGAFERDIARVVRDWVRVNTRDDYWPYPSYRTPDDMRAELAGVDE